MTVKHDALTKRQKIQTSDNDGRATENENLIEPGLDNREKP